MDTHAEKRMLPPIMIIVSKGYMLRFQPQKRVQFNLFNKGRWWSNRTLEDTIIPFLPQHPNRSTPYNFQERMRKSKQARHVSKMNKVLSDVARHHRRNA